MLRPEFPSSEFRVPRVPSSPRFHRVPPEFPPEKLAPSEKIQRAIESGEVGVAFEGIVAKQLSDQFPGELVGVGLPVKDPTTGKMLTDIDVALKTASVELKAGQKVIDLKKLNRLKALGKPVIWYAPQASGKEVSILRNAGAYGVARNYYELLSLIKQTKGCVTTPGLNGGKPDTTCN